MSLNRTYGLAIASLFALGISMPLAIFLLSEDRDRSLIENRKLSSFPVIQWDADNLQQFPEKFTSYFQDHFGLRDNLIDLNSSIMLDYFDTSPSPFVLKGKDNWFFYIAGDIAEDHFGLRNAQVEQLEKVSEVLIDHREWLRSLGIQYLFVPVPNKINVYADKLPDRIKGLSGMTYYQQLTQYRDEEISENIVDVYQLLKQARKDRDVYYRTDTHWNYDGALVTFNQIIIQLKQWFTELTTINENNIVRKEITLSGDLTNMLHQINDISEKNSHINVIAPCASSNNKFSLSNSLYSKIRNIEPSRALPFENGCQSENLTVLVIHDSFGAYLRPFLNEKFKKVVYSNKYNLRELQEFIMALKPDIVIEERVMRDVNHTLAHDLEMEEKVVAFQMSEVERSLLDISENRENDTVQSTINVSVKKITDGYNLYARNADPQLFFKFRPEGRVKRYNVMVELIAPDDTHLRLFYKIPGMVDFDQKHSVLREIKKGYNKLYFHLPHAQLDGRVRLDPGSVAGEYLLRTFIIKERYGKGVIRRH